MRFISTIVIALLVSSPIHAQKPTEEEELALVAMEGLMQQPAERAMPVLKKVLEGSQTTLVKKRALFVLSQTRSPEAQELLLQTARSNSALRGEAIRSIGIGGNRKSLDALQELYDTGTEDVKKEVLHAWVIAGRKDTLYQTVLNAKDEKEARRAIHMLSVMGATEELRRLGDQPNAPPGLTQAYAVAGDLTSLRKIIEGNGEQAARVEAVRSIGIIRSDAARTTLRDIYSRSTDEPIKKAALDGLLIANDQQGVLALYQSASTADEKRVLLRALTSMSGDAALQAIDAVLEEKK